MPTTLPSSTPSSDFTAPHSLTAVAAGGFGGTAPYGNTGCGVFIQGVQN